MYFLAQAIRALKKKMKHLDGLILKQKNGEALDDQQLESIESLGDVISKLEYYMKYDAEDLD